MLHMRLLGVVLGVLFVLASIGTAAAAAAEIKILPEATEAKPILFKIKSGTDTFAITGGAFPVKCVNDEGAGDWIGRRNAEVDILLLDCTTAGGLVKCTGLSDTVAGSILIKGLFIGRRGPGGTVRGHLRPEPAVHFTCSSTLIEENGCIVTTITPINTKTKVITITMKQKEGKDEFEEILNEGETANEACGLKASENGGSEKTAGQEATEELEGSEQESKAIEVEVMA